MKKIVIIGAGHMARAHLDVLVKMHEVYVAGIYSRTMDRASAVAKDYNIPYVATSLTALFEETYPDGAVVAVTETETRDVCLEASNFQCLLLVEKPLGLSLTEYNSIKRGLEKKQAKLFVALNRRYYGSVFEAQRELKTTGSCRRTITINDQEAPFLALQGGRDPKVVKQWHFANSIHLIDLFFVFARGGVKSVRNIIPWRGVKTNFIHSVIEFDSGDIGIYHALWDAPGPWSLTIETKQKRLHLQPLEDVSLQVFPSRTQNKIATHDADVKFKPGLLRQMEGFIAALNGKPNNLPSLESYCKTAQLIDSLYKEELG
jgi:predicted dehydrogenase